MKFFCTNLSHNLIWITTFDCSWLCIRTPYDDDKLYSWNSNL